MIQTLLPWLGVSGLTVVLVGWGRRSQWGPMTGGLIALMILIFWAVRSARTQPGFFAGQSALLILTWVTVGLAAEALARAVRERRWRVAVLEALLVAFFIYWAVGYTLPR